LLRLAARESSCQDLRPRENFFLFKTSFEAKKKRFREARVLGTIDS
jgi:hypothetical protein